MLHFKQTFFLFFLMKYVKLRYVPDLRKKIFRCGTLHFELKPTIQFLNMGRCAMNRSLKFSSEVREKQMLLKA